MNETDHINEQRRREGCHTYHQDLDAAALNRLREAYGQVIPTERLAAMEQMPTSYDTPDEFQRAYREATGSTPRKNVEGFSHPLEDGLSAHVNTARPELAAEITLHERLHQASDPQAESQLGRPTYEGITQDLTVQALGLDPQAGERTGYPREAGAAAELRRLCGHEAVEAAYFKGDTRELKRCIEEQLGPENLTDLAHADRKTDAQPA